jgi:carbon monoxide dehydrogenase subunit G
MDMTGEERIAASREVVWAALNDPEVLKQCIPGCESLERVSDTEMTAKVKLTIGPVSARFSGKVTLSEIDPPNGYRIAGEGSGGAAGYAKGSALVRLVEDGDGTVLRYEAKADVGGKLAQLGSRLIDATAKKLAGEFFSKFGTVVGPVAAEGDAAGGEPAKKPGVLSRWFGKRKEGSGGDDASS